VTIAGLDLSQIGAFLLVALLVELTPGPNMGWLAALSAKEGLKAGAAAVAGVTLGLATLAFAAGFGLNALIERDHRLIHVIDWAGVAIIAALAWEAGRGVLHTTDPEKEAVKGGARAAFQRGLLTNLFNAKAIGFFAAVPTRFARAGGLTGSGLSLLLSGYLIVAILVHAGVVLLAAQLGGRTNQRTLAAISAAGLAAVTVWLAWKAAHGP
jgi:threonine/homoserine/homoserine lactone efflux protein